MSETNVAMSNAGDNNALIKTTIRVGSRKSELALVQTRHVIALLRKLYPEQKFEIHTMTTMGDRILNISLPKIGEKSLFTKDLEDALKNGVVDFVVHSLKDLPTALPDGMAIGAVLEREDPRDALVLAKEYDGKCLKTLPEGSIIGTSSLRRTAQIARKYPHLKVHDIRGNLNTRLAKLDAPGSKYAGIILAQAGLVRMGWQNRINQTIEPNDILYAVGQGALAVECRSNDSKILEMLCKLTCIQTQCRILTERSFLKTLGGGCSAPVAVDSVLIKRKFIDMENNSIDKDLIESHGYELNIIGSVWSLDGQIEIQASNKCKLNLNAEQDDEVIPRKKIKLSVDITDESQLDAKNSKLSPPQVVDHSKLLDENFTKSNLDELNDTNLDLAGLINVHKDAFKKCPYSSVLTNALSNPTSPIPLVSETNKSEPLESLPDAPTDSHIKCPLSFPVGQDVMGQCPYFDTSDVQNVCKFIEMENNISTQNESAIPVAAVCPHLAKGSTNQTESVAKCPFAHTKPAEAEESSSKCPFLVAPASAATEIEIGPEETCDTLFCGLYPHKCWPLHVYSRCEKLGQDLAAQLIEKNALKVMEIAQNEIRQKA